ncbi:MAG: DUF2029 domain-containing protein [Sphingomonadales bacterium]|nr:DUF2029 domain-containing protein [Sphingomonadales bacterium]MDE2568014.1 DUF2029 domain-containing protein [Sphingomonadales bacterium]
MFAPGAIGPNYQGVGTDWMVFHGAARLLHGGNLAILYDGGRFTAYLNATFAPYLFDPVEYRPWVNPPWFLLAVAPFGLLGFIASYSAGQLLQYAGWTTVLRKAGRCNLGKRELRCAIAIGLVSPALALNALCGQTAPLVATLALLVLGTGPRSEWLAGAALALITFKPQFGPVLVVYLIASRQWGVLGRAVLAGVLLVAASIIVLGITPWIDWLKVIAQGLSGEGSWNAAARLWGNSVFACLALSGVPTGIATALQNLVSLGSLVAAWVITRRDMNYPRRTGALILLMLLAAPYFAGYDAVLALSALMVAYLGDPRLMPRSLHGWTVPLLVWVIPFYSPPALNPIGRITPLIIAAALIQLYRAGRHWLPASATPPTASTPEATA